MTTLKKLEEQGELYKKKLADARKKLKDLDDTLTKLNIAKPFSILVYKTPPEEFFKRPKMGKKKEASIPKTAKFYMTKYIYLTWEYSQRWDKEANESLGKYRLCCAARYIDLAEFKGEGGTFEKAIVRDSYSHGHDFSFETSHVLLLLAAHTEQFMEGFLGFLDKDLTEEIEYYRTKPELKID